MKEWKIIKTRDSRSSEQEKLYKKLQEHEMEGWIVHTDSFGMTNAGNFSILLSRDKDAIPL